MSKQINSRKIVTILLILLIFLIPDVKASIRGRIYKIEETPEEDLISTDFEQGVAKIMLSDGSELSNIIDSAGQYDFNLSQIYCWEGCNIFPTIYLKQINILEKSNFLTNIYQPFSNSQDDSGLYLLTGVYPHILSEKDPILISNIDNSLAAQKDLQSSHSYPIYSVYWNGTLNIPEHDEYAFYLNISGICEISIDNKIVHIKSDPVKEEISFALNLNRGNHSYTIQYYNEESYNKPNMYWSSESITKQKIPKNYLSFSNGGSIKIKGLKERVMSKSTTLAYPYGRLSFDIYATNNNVVSSRIPILFVHGWSNKEQTQYNVWGNVTEDLEKKNHDCWKLIYNPANLNNTLNAGMLKTAIGLVLNEYPSKSELDVVSHSMGGLATRGYIQDLGVSPSNYQRQYNDDIRKYVIIASPMKGTYKANLVNDRYDFPTSCDNIVDPVFKVNIPSEATLDLEVGSDFTWNLNYQLPKMSIDYLTVGGFEGYALCFKNYNQVDDGVVPMWSSNLLKYGIPHVTLKRVHTTIESNSNTVGIIDDFINGRGTASIKANLNPFLVYDEEYIDPNDALADRTYYQKKGSTIITFTNPNKINNVRLTNGLSNYDLEQNSRTKRWFYLNPPNSDLWDDENYTHYTLELNESIYDLYYDGGNGLSDSGNNVVIEADSVTYILIDNADDDNDGILNKDDVCPSTYGTYCNGCPEPDCGICKYPYCPPDNNPECLNHDITTLCNSTSQCSPGIGNNNFGIGGNYSCQGYCDGIGNCDYANNCQLDQNCFACIDTDGDGFNQSQLNCGTIDCNDSDNKTHPNAEEICDLKDNDCNGEIDEGNVCQVCTEEYCNQYDTWHYTDNIQWVGNCIETMQREQKYRDYACSNNNDFSEVEWNKTIGGIESDEAYSVQQVSDGYIVAGSTGNLSDVWLIKTDSNGNGLWNKTFGKGTAYSVQQTSDNGYIVAGNYTKSGKSDVWLIKTDSNGDEEWNKTFGGSYNSTDGAHSVQQTSDNGYIVTGGYTLTHTDKFIWLIKTDSNGNEEWNKTFGGGHSDAGYSVQQTSDGGYIVTGKTYSFHFLGDAWLIKTDSNGNEEWNKTFDGNSNEGAYSVQQTIDGGYVVAGKTYLSQVKGYNAWLIKTDIDGDEEWNKTFGESYNDIAYSVQQTSDGGYIVGGAKGTEQQFDFILIKTDSIGNQEWNKTFNHNSYDKAYSVQQTSDGGYIVTGSTGSALAWPRIYDIWLIKLKPEQSPCDYSLTQTQWIDTSITKNKEDGTACDDSLWCTESDICTSGICNGSKRDCSANDLDEIATCDYDNDPFTWDYAEAFISECYEEADSCTLGAQGISHTCDTGNCSAECEEDEDCGCQDNGCIDADHDGYVDDFAEYPAIGVCTECDCKPCVAAITINDYNHCECIPNIVLNETWSACDKTDYQYKNYYDTNYCPDTELENPINQTCDYCTPEWECDGYEDCKEDDIQLCNEANDKNDCYVKTNLDSDKFDDNYSRFDRKYCDYDNNGIIGNKNNISTNIQNLNIIIDNSSNLSNKFTNKAKVEIKEGDNTICEFNCSFTNPMNLANITIQKQDVGSNQGSILISGLNLPAGETKIVKMDRVDANADRVCILDQEILTINEISSNCTGQNEESIICNGTTQNGYTCELNAGIYMISGLKHSGLIEYNTNPPQDTGDNGGGDTGGGGGGGGGASSPRCSPAWLCGKWSACSMLGKQRCKDWIDLNNCGEDYTGSWQRDCIYIGPKETEEEPVKEIVEKIEEKETNESQAFLTPPIDLGIGEDQAERPWILGRAIQNIAGNRVNWLFAGIAVLILVGVSVFVLRKLRR